MAGQDLDQRLRAAAFAYLDRLRARDGDRIFWHAVERVIAELISRIRYENLAAEVR